MDVPTQLRLLVRAEQLRLFGAPVQVRGHVRHTEAGAVLVEPHVRHVEPPHVSPPIAAPSSVAAAPPDRAPSSVATQAILDTELRRFNLGDDDRDPVLTEARLLLESGKIAHMTGAIPVAASTRALTKKVDEIVTEDAVLDAFGTKGRWVSEDEVKAAFYHKAPIVAMDIVEARVHAMIRTLRDKKLLDPYYRSAPDEGPYMRLTPLDPEKVRTENLARSISDLEDMRRFLRPYADDVAKIREAWSQLPRAVRTRWPEFHPELYKDFHGRLSAIRFMEDEVRRFGGTVEPLNEWGQLGALGRGPETIDPRPTEDPSALATDGARAVRTIRPGTLVWFPAQEKHYAMAGRTFEPARVMLVSALVEARGEDVAVPAVSAMPGRSVINVPQPGFQFRDAERRTRLWGQADLVAALDGGARVVAHDVPEAVYAKLTRRAPDAHRVVAVTVDDRHYWYAVGDRSSSVILDEEGHLVRGPLLSRVTEAVTMAKGDQLHGGLADHASPDDFDADALRTGTRHELEHTDDEDVAREIAMDHLAEDPDYYWKLRSMEKGGGAKLVDFYHQEEGRKKTGTILSSGAKGAVVHDHETGKAVRVAHGHYWDPRAAAATSDGAPPEATQPKAAPSGDQEAPLTVPGLDAPGERPEKPGYARDPVDEAKPGERPAVRASHQAGLERVRRTGARLGATRRRINDHLRSGGTGEAPIHAVLLSAIEQGGLDAEQAIAATPQVDADGVTIADVRVDNPRATSIVRAMRAKNQKKGWRYTDATGQEQDVTPTTLDAYCRRVTDGQTVADLRAFRATAHAVTHLETEGTGAMGHRERVERLARAHGAADDAMPDGGRLVDPSIARAFHQGHRFDAEPAAGDTDHELLTNAERRVTGHLAQVHAKDPWGIRGGGPDENDRNAGIGPSARPVGRQG